MMESDGRAKKKECVEEWRNGGMEERNGEESERNGSKQRGRIVSGSSKASKEKPTRGLEPLTNRLRVYHSTD